MPATKLAKLAGISRRHLQRLAGEGAVPGAVRRASGRWSYPDTPDVRDWAKGFQRWGAAPRRDHGGAKPKPVPDGLREECEQLSGLHERYLGHSRKFHEAARKLVDLAHRIGLAVDHHLADGGRLARAGDTVGLPRGLATFCHQVARRRMGGTDDTDTVTECRRLWKRLPGGEVPSADQGKGDGRRFLRLLAQLEEHGREAGRLSWHCGEVIKRWCPGTLSRDELADHAGVPAAWVREHRRARRKESAHGMTFPPARLERDYVAPETDEQTRSTRAEVDPQGWIAPLEKLMQAWGKAIEAAPITAWTRPQLERARAYLRPLAQDFEQIEGRLG